MNKLSQSVIALILSLYAYWILQVSNISLKLQYSNSCQMFKDQQLGKVFQVEELDVSELDRNKTLWMVANRKTPLVIKNVLKQEDLEKLTVPQFCKDFADIPANYRTGIKLDTSDPDKYDIINKNRLNTTLQQYCQKYLYQNYRNKYEAPYLAKFEKHQEFERLSLPMERFQWIFDKLPNASIWLATKNSGTFLHTGSIPNFSLQLSGVKEWTIFDIDQSPKICFNEPYPKGFSWSKYDFADENSCCTGKTADRYKLTMQPGDVLFLPKYLPHAVDNNEVNLMVNFWIEKKRFEKGEDVLKYRKYVDKN